MTTNQQQHNGAGIDFKVQRNPWKRSYTTRTQAWWDCAEFADDYPSQHMNGTEYKTTKKDEEEDVWDISDSLVDINPDNYMGHILKIFPPKRQKLKEEEIQKWIDQDTSHGFIRVYPPDETTLESQLVPCDLKTTAQKICLQLGHPTNALHVQYNGDIIKRLDPYTSPLGMQNEYLTSIGYNDNSRIQAEGAKESLSYQIKFYTGKPLHDYTYSRHYLASVLLVRKGKMFHQWSERLCIISGTRLLIYKDKTKSHKPAILQLAKGAVEVVKFKEHEYCLKLTAVSHHDKSIYLSFLNEAEFAKWLRKCKKATSKLPTIVDLSSCHLEFIPETVFVNTELRTLNLRHNVIRERPLEEDIYTIGWLDDIPRFQCMRSLNLADNDLGAFPGSICQIQSLAEVNLSNNRIEEIPADIGKLKNLQALHIHNNHLVSLPEELLSLERLQFLVLAFNNFTNVPMVMANLSELGITEVESIIMAGNMIEKIPPEILHKLNHVRKMDLRMNRLTLPPTETVKFSLMEHLTFLDIRDNEIVDLDIRCVRTLEYLNCERNKIVNIQVNGTQLKHFQASHNNIQQLLISPKPEWLAFLDISFNNLASLPEFLSTCFFMQRLFANNNRLKTLPQRLFCDAQSLKILKVDHNLLTGLPLETETVNLEEMYVQHNWLSSLPKTFLMKANKLRIFNASHNRLVSLPSPHSTEDLNKFQELYLSHNLLQDDVMNTICQYPRLKVLHLAYNNLYEVNETLMSRLEMLNELNLSGNSLETIPECLATFANLSVLRAHSNRLRTLPNFSTSKSLKVLDVGSNKLLNVSVASLMDSQISLLDMSLNEQLSVSKEEISHLKNKKKVCMVDSTGQNRSLPGPISLESEFEEINPQPWQVGLAESAGSRNKLNIAIIKKVRLGGHNDAVFAMFDGGMNHEVPKLLQKRFLEILDDELLHPKTGQKYLKYVMITAHRSLKATGQKLGASATLIHISKHYTPSGDRYLLNVANVGDTEAVMCRNDEVVLLTRSFRVSEDRAELQRIVKTDGIITEDNKVYGTGLCTRLLGCCSLYPHVIPDPHVHSLTLGPDDKFIILANKQLWTHVTYQEAVVEVMHMNNPVLAAKKLQDLAQSYGCKENISVLVVELFFGDYGYETYNNDLGHKADDSFHLSKVMETIEEVPLLPHQDSLTRQKMKPNASQKVKPLPQRKFVRKSTPQEWETILQERLSKNVKQYEVQSSVNEVINEPPLSVAGNEDEEDEGSSSNQRKDTSSGTRALPSALPKLNQLRSRGCLRLMEIYYGASPSRFEYSGLQSWVCLVRLILQ
ncbi:PH domain leucine-rich repeat-containing protein phosphatase 2-like isoform X2 [Lineus longissimus]|uniref:PH domain leucine-rich repeat-containing protein phosphatase 2-like isoform X2 n=1 Tax=Lineus longissimus TaxID=88925 RepID=UPI00315C8601